MGSQGTDTGPRDLTPIQQLTYKPVTYFTCSQMHQEMRKWGNYCAHPNTAGPREPKTGEPGGWGVGCINRIVLFTPWSSF